MRDILFDFEEGRFSYRVSGICIENGCVLLQKPDSDDGYAFPGGHVSFGETNEETLIREWKEELGADISVGELKWVGEVFFPWGKGPCHQISLTYLVHLEDKTTPRESVFSTKEKTDLKFYWIPLADVKKLPVYPTQTAELLEHLSEGVQHFVYRQEGELV